MASEQDLGCGDGTTALLEVKLGAEVLGVDIPAKDATSIPATFLRIYVAV